MCGRYALHAHPDVIKLQFGLSAVPEIQPLYNIAPSAKTLVVHQDRGGKRLADLYRWGLIPAWAKDPSIGDRLVNARGETVAEKPAFKGAFRSSRCLVPASGFYEWKSIFGRKHPYYIRPKGGELFALAGITELWKGPVVQLHTVCLITTEPNELMRPIHDRMPVIVEPENYGAWLDPSNVDVATLKRFITSYPAERMETYEVSKTVSNARNEGKELIVPLETA